MNDSVNNLDSENIESDVLKCEGCGSNLEFDPQSQKLICRHCGKTVDFFQDRNVEEIDISKAFDALDDWDGAKVVRCENCGAKMTVAEDNLSMICPYCQTAHVLKIEDIKGVKPNAVYPFSVTSNEAVLLARNWAKSKLFSPKSFKRNLAEQNLKGIYLPCWTFDSNTITDYVGRVGYYRTRTVRTKNGIRTETYVVWRYISGRIVKNFDDVTVIADESAQNGKIQNVLSYPSQQIKVYEKKYLAGFYAKHYDKDIKASWREAKAEISQKIRRAIAGKHCADVVDYIKTDTRYRSITYKYVLLPVWSLTYPYKGKRYNVYVNGCTGKTSGKAPTSWVRVLIAVGFGVVAVAAILALLFSGLNADAQNVIFEDISRFLI